MHGRRQGGVKGFRGTPPLSIYNLDERLQRSYLYKLARTEIHACTIWLENNAYCTIVRALTT